MTEMTDTTTTPTLEWKAPRKGEAASRPTHTPARCRVRTNLCGNPSRSSPFANSLWCHRQSRLNRR